MNASTMAAGRRRWWALGALAVSSLVVGLDLTVLNLALPTWPSALHITSGDMLQWFVVSYSLVFAAMLLPAGLLGDRFGRKRLLIVALVVFGVASLACAYSASAGQLIAARALLGLGAAFILPLSIAVIPVLFTEDERQRAITVVMGMTMVAFPIGPILGGWLLTHFWWGSVFLINVPVIVVALVAVALLMPESRSTRRAPIDYSGVVLSSVGLTLLSYGLIEAGQKGWGHAADIAWTWPSAPWCSSVSWAGSASCRGATTAARWSTSPCFARAASPGARSSPPWSRSPCSACCSRCRPTTRRSSASIRWAPACGCCP